MTTPAELTPGGMIVREMVPLNLEMPFGSLDGSQTIAVTLECAGNGRAFLTPRASGAQWERGAVGNAEWTGVLLADLLRRAGVKDSAREVILEGADEGEIKEPPGPAGKIHYARTQQNGSA